MPRTIGVKFAKTHQQSSFKCNPMIILHIEHPVPNFEAWKKAFVSDPIDRKASGVRKYRIFMAVTNANYVAIDLEFDNFENAESTLKKLQSLWGNVDGTLIHGPKAHIFEVIEEANV